MSDKSSIFQKVREQAKKISHLGAKSATKLAKEPVEKFKVTPHSGEVLEGQVSQRDAFDLDYQDIQQLFRHQFPSVTRQVLGKRYTTINKISRLILPNGMDQAADEILQILSEFATKLASTDKVLAETGSKSIQELQQNLQRSQRAGGALKEVNKIIAGIQGGFSGMTGLIGAAADLPCSVILSLKTIYEIGHAYGFELDNEEDQQAVFYALSKSDLSLIAEKQVLFLGLRSIQNIFKTGDYHELQSFLNSNYSFEQFQALITDADGQYKWSSLKVLSKVKILKYATPIVGGAVGAFYNIKLIDEVASHADEVFSHARQYLLDNKREDISALSAYHLAIKNIPRSNLTTEQLSDQNTVVSQVESSINELREVNQPEKQRVQSNEHVEIPVQSKTVKSPRKTQQLNSELSETEQKIVTENKTLSATGTTVRRRSPSATKTTSAVKRPRTKKTEPTTQVVNTPKRSKVTKKTDGNE